MSLETITPPAAPAVSLDDVIDHVRLILEDDVLPDEELVTLYRETAIGRIEAETGRALINRTLRFKADRFCQAIALPVAPVVSVSSVGYVDANGDLQTLDASAYSLVDRLDWPRIVPSYGLSFPATRQVPEAVTVEFVAGYGAADADVPGELRTAVLQTTAGLYAYREDVTTAGLGRLPNGVERLIADFVRWSL